MARGPALLKTQLQWLRAEDRDGLTVAHYDSWREQGAVHWGGVACILCLPGTLRVDANIDVNSLTLL